MTALRTRVYLCLLAWTDHLPKILNERTFNITEIELVAIAGIQRRLPGVEMTEVEAHMASYSLFAKDHQRDVVHRQYKF